MTSEISPGRFPRTDPIGQQLQRRVAELERLVAGLAVPPSVKTRQIFHAQARHDAQSDTLMMRFSATNGDLGVLESIEVDFTIAMEDGQGDTAYAFKGSGNVAATKKFGSTYGLIAGGSGLDLKDVVAPSTALADRKTSAPFVDLASAAVGGAQSLTFSLVDGSFVMEVTPLATGIQFDFDWTSVSSYNTAFNNKAVFMLARAPVALTPTVT